MDNVKSRIAVHKHLKAAKGIADIYETPLYWLDFGNTQNTGQVILGTIGKVKQPTKTEFSTQATLPTICDLFDLTQISEEDSGPSCSLADALKKQDLLINSTLAQLGSSLLWKLFREGRMEHHGVFLNLATLKSNPLAVGG